MAVTAIFKQHPSELEGHYEQRLGRVLLAQHYVQDVEHLRPVQQVGLFVRPRDI